MLVFLAKKSPWACASRTNLSFFEKRCREFETCPCRGVSVFFLRIFRHVSDVKKWCKSWLPSSGLMWQASSEHAALAAKAWICHGPVWPMKNMEIPGGTVHGWSVPTFFGGGFFGWKFTYSSRLGFVKSWWFFYGFSNHGIHHYGMETTTGWWFHLFFVCSPLLGGRYIIQFWPLLFQIGWSWNHQLDNHLGVSKN